MKLNDQEKNFLKKHSIYDYDNLGEIMYNFIVDTGITPDLNDFTNEGKIALKILRKVNEEQQKKYDKRYDLSNFLLNIGADFYQKKNYKEAVRYYEKSSDLGNVCAISNLGYCYYYGRYVDVDYDRAYYYFDKASKLNDVAATYKIGDMVKNNMIDSDIAYYKYYFKAYNLVKNTKDIYTYPDVCYRLAKYYLDIDKIRANDFIIEACIYFKIRIEDNDNYTDNLYINAIDLKNKLKEEKVLSHLRLPDTIKLTNRSDLYEEYIKLDDGYKINIDREKIISFITKSLINVQENYKLIINVPNYMDDYINSLNIKYNKDEDYTNIYEINTNKENLISMFEELFDYFINENLIEFELISDSVKIKKNKFNYIEVNTKEFIIFDKILNDLEILEVDYFISGYGILKKDGTKAKITSYDNVEFSDFLLYLDTYDIDIKFIKQLKD